MQHFRNASTALNSASEMEVDASYTVDIIEIATDRHKQKKYNRKE